MDTLWSSNIHEIEFIMKKYVKMWDNDRDKYLQSHKAGLYIAQYKNAMDVKYLNEGMEQFIQLKIKNIKSLKLEEFITDEEDIEIVKKWIEKLK